MSSDEFSLDSDSSVDAKPSKAKSKTSDKKLSVERIYQKKTQLEHILLRPDTYIGSVEKETTKMWVHDEESGMQNREISYVPGLYKIFDEVLVNAADNKQRDKSMSCIRIDIDPETNEISIYNNGKGIPVIEHKDEKMFVPTLIFGHLLTSSNYDDNEKKVVGGRNGYGAKLCNIFSTRFKVETSCREYQKSFCQVWTDNMMSTKEPKISKATGEDFTRITFSPDLAKFKMTHLDKDIVALFSRRAYDLAGSTKGVSVYLNGKRLPIKGFKDYCELFTKDKEDDNNQPLKIAFESVNERWEVGVTVSDKGFQQISFVNSIATTRGGKHVDYVSDQIVSKISEIIKKKNKAGVKLKPFQIKNHLWVFVNCLIENPTFDSQTKETMTLQAKSFGSKCIPNEKFFNAVNRVGIVEAVMTWVRFKAQTELSKQCNAKKQSKLKGVPKLEDANDAGTRNSIDCTLILTEGDSAKSLVVAGLGVIGRDKYGVFPLRGKMLNVREATHKQILDNAEINSLIKILGLQYKKQYSGPDDLKTLRYGKVMIMTDQDQDGSHIKGLLINFIHYNWPKLLELNFLEEFITPIVKVRKGSERLSFFSLPEFKEWKKETPNWSSWTIKYYKGLGTSDAQEAKEYFNDMRRHRISFKYTGTEDDHFIKLAFSKKMVEQRKDWLTNSLEERTRRREWGLPEVYLYESNTRSVSYKDFVNKELILFSNMDNERSIPSLMDGLKPGQRKVIFTCFLRNDKREVKVAQLAGSVGEKSAYHHGETSLMSTIINLAQNFVGSNNINLLIPSGQFGTRLQGGKDSASARYIFTKLSPLARKIFPPLDDPLLNSLYDDNLKIEPEYYVPIIPMVLVNGAEGIGTGWSTKIPNYNPRDIVDNIRRLLRGEQIVPMKPWFKGFRGTITQVDTQKYVTSGEVGLLDEKSFEITELPIRTWTQTYKESVLESLLHGTEKTPSFINEYREYHTESTIRFVVTLSEANLRKAESDGMHKMFKLQSSISTTSMVLFDHKGCIKKYESPEEMLEEFFPVRLEFYLKRKAYYEGKLEAEALKLENMARFIVEKNEHKLRMENVRKNNFVEQLIERNYDSDPVKAWLKKNCSEDDKLEDNSDEEDDEVDNDRRQPGVYDFNYLFNMSMRSMLREKVDELLKQRDTKKEELEQLKRKTPEDLWEDDLKAFLDELEKLEQEAERLEAADNHKTTKAFSKSKGSKKTMRVSIEAKPSAFAERVEPKIDFENYKKTDKTPKKTKAIKKGKDEEEGVDPFDALLDGEENGDGEKKKAPKKSTKTTANGTKKSNDSEEKTNKKKRKPAEKGKEKGKSAKKGRNPWSEDESEDDVMSLNLSSEEDRDDDFVFKKKVENKIEDEVRQDKQDKFDSVFGINSFERSTPVSAEPIDEPKIPPLIIKAEKPKATKPKVQKKKKKGSDSESEKPKPKKTKKSAFSDSEDEVSELSLSQRLSLSLEGARDQPQRQRKTTKYVFSDDSDDNDSD